MALLGNLTGSSQFFNPNNFYNGVATQSLRFDDGSSAKLEKTPNASNRKTHTLSMWIKRCELGADNSLLRANGSGDTGRTDIWFDTNDKLNVAGSSTYFRITNRRFRDVSSWYHIVFAFDTTDGTADNRLKIYVNGVQETSFATNNAYSQNTDYGINGNVAHQIGTGYAHFDGYIAEVNFIDGTQYDASYFGETKNGVWIPKGYSSSYGTNGFRLQFKQTGTGTASASTIGADTSGNDNHYTSTNLVASDSNMPDCPENNFATMNSLSFALTTDNISEGNLKVGQTDQHVHTSTFGVPTSGKWYWEINSVSSNGSNYYMPYAGVVNSTFFHAEQDQSGDVGDNLRARAGLAYIRGNDTIYKNLSSTSNPVDGTNKADEATASAEQGILGIALDSDAGTLKYYWNNSLARTDSTLTAGDLYFPYNFGTNSGGNLWNFNYYNFGQDSSFAGTKTAQGNTDANGNGDFYYAVPTGHLALCTSNLPEPTISPNSLTQADDHFNTLLWTGNNTDNRAITGLGFKPDLVIIKKRSGNTSPMLIDSSHPTSNGSTSGFVGTVNLLQPNSTNGQTTGDGRSDGGFVSFDTDGFTLGQAPAQSGYPNAGYEAVNGGDDALHTYVGWSWKANGASSTTNDASATGVGTIDSTFQANTTAGFSIVKYEATGSAGTIKHGLSQAPNFMIVKSRDQAGTGWMVYYGDNTDYVVLEGSGATIDGQSTWNDTTPTSSVFSVGVNGGDTNNSSGGSMVGYMFHSVDGYSKFGNFTGNGNADGTFVYTGFRPAWVLIKNTARSADWRLHDIARQPTNDEGGHIILLNVSTSEVTNEYDIDFLSNGFKLRSGDVYENGSGELVIYAAFAEAPFKYANAR